MQPDPFMLLSRLGRVGAAQLMAMPEQRDPWRTPPYVPPPAQPLLDRANALSEDMEAKAAATRSQQMAASHSPLRVVAARQSPLVTPERLTGVLVSLTG